MENNEANLSGGMSVDNRAVNNSAAAPSSADGLHAASAAPVASAGEPTVQVALVGAGPGDPGLITVQGRDLLRHANIVVYDYLSNDALLAEAPADAQLVSVGKKGFAKHLTQPEINDLLVRKARELQASGGGLIVRLKGGDPFVFGRGGEEALALRQAGIPFQVVPGVTSGVAAPAYAGIPVTHRTVSSSVTFITGHEDPTKDRSAIDWPALARLAVKGGTLCFYMGMRNLELIVSRLMDEGLAADTPVALVRWGTLPAQRTLVAPLSQVAQRAREAGFAAPVIILVGQVAGLREQLVWYERAPLFGRSIVVTRSRAQAPAFTKRLHDLGADVRAFPAIECVAPESYAALDAAIDQLSGYDWVVFTSVNGVERFFERLQQCMPAGRPADARALAGARIATIGPATAAYLRTFGLIPDAVPTTYRGEAVCEAMQQVCAAAGTSLDGARVLLPRAQVARQALPDLLRQAGAQVDVVPAYQTVAPHGPIADDLAQALRDGTVDAVTFTSSSTVRNLLTMLGDDAATLLAGCELFSIGPVTSATLRQAGLSRIHEAQVYTIDGLIACLCDFYTADKG
jgi:uroporphyrinogen III methyltransferase/synthase